MATALRARLVLAEARTLGLDLADLLAAAELHASMPTLTDWVAEVEPTFTPATATTYRPYWRLAVDLFGDRRVTSSGAGLEVEVASLLNAVAEVDDAAGESVLIDELKIGSRLGRQCGVAPTKDDRPDKQGQLVDQPRD